MGDSEKAAPRPPAVGKPQSKVSPLRPDGGKKKPGAKERAKDQSDDMFEGNKPDDMFEGDQPDDMFEG